MVSFKSENGIFVQQYLWGMKPNRPFPLKYNVVIYFEDKGIKQDQIIVDMLFLKACKSENKDGCSRYFNIKQYQNYSLMIIFPLIIV